MPKIESQPQTIAPVAPVVPALPATMPLTGSPAHAAGLMPVAPGGLVSISPRASSSTSGLSGIKAAPTGHTAPELAGSDFIILDEPKPTTVGMVFARDGHGKTHLLANYAPEPVVFIGLDGGRGEREIKKAQNRGRKIYYLDASMPGNVIHMSHEQAQEHGRAALEVVTRNFEWTVTKSVREWGRGTLVFDTSTELRDIVRVAVRGRVDRPQPKKGDGFLVAQTDAIINRTLKYFCDRARNSNLNLILLSRAKPIYEGREDTGRVTWDTDKIFSQAADWIIEYRLAAGGLLGGVVPLMVGVGGPAPVAVPGVAPMGAFGVGAAGPGPSFEIAVTNPKCAIEEMGKVYRMDEWGTRIEGPNGAYYDPGPFAAAMCKLIPGSKLEDWR